jgi:hypothetical protein
MSKIKAKIDCCGSNFETEQVSIFGLLTLSVPLTIICLILLLPSLPFSSLRKSIITIIKANLSLIEKQDILPRFRCNVSVWGNKLSPSLSRALYDQFNIVSLVLCWTVIISGVSLFV